MPKELVDRRTGRTRYRYSSAKMSGPLPPTLFKYLPLAYAERMLDGELLFSTLSWFQHLEDPDRGDELEGTRKYFPVGGLEATKIGTGGKLDLAWQRMTLASDSLHSKAAQSDHILIFCTSLRSGLATFDDPRLSNACVEIYNPLKFLTRLRNRLARWTPTRAVTLIHDEIRYWSESEPLGSVHALPHELALHKHERFRGQHEYRFAFGAKADVFDFENVHYFLVREGVRRPRVEPSTKDHRMLVQIGSLADCCRLI